MQLKHKLHFLYLKNRSVGRYFEWGVLADFASHLSPLKNALLILFFCEPRFGDPQLHIKKCLGGYQEGGLYSLTKIIGFFSYYI